MNARRAQLNDVPRMMPLLNEYARQAEILPRTEEDVYRSIREWVVVEQDDTLVAMGSLLIMWRDLAEIRSLVVDSAYQGLGFGRDVVSLLLDEAKILQLEQVFALTRKPAFFMKMGFHLTHIQQLPRKVQRDCVFCPKFHACDEVAVIMHLTQTRFDGAGTSPVSANGVAPGSFIPLRIKN